MGKVKELDIDRQNQERETATLYADDEAILTATQEEDCDGLLIIHINEAQNQAVSGERIKDKQTHSKRR